MRPWRRPGPTAGDDADAQPGDPVVEYADASDGRPPQKDAMVSPPILAPSSSPHERPPARRRAQTPPQRQLPPVADDKHVASLSSGTRDEGEAGVATALADELELLSIARRALDAGDDELSLAATRRHAERFEHGALEDVRRALAVRALCRLGRTADAQREAADLRRDFPRSAAAKGVARTCTVLVESGDSSR